MSNMYVSEYAETGRTIQGVVGVGQEPSTTDQTVSFTATAGTSVAFQTSTRLVRIHVDGLASVLFGTAPTASVTSTIANNKRMTAGQTEYFFVPQGMSYKVSAVTCI